MQRVLVRQLAASRTPATAGACPHTCVEFTNEVGSTGTRADLFTAFSDGACCTWAQRPCHVLSQMLQWCELELHPPSLVSCCGAVAFAKTGAGQGRSSLFMQRALRLSKAHLSTLAEVVGLVGPFAYEWNSPRARHPLTTQTCFNSAAVMRLLIGQQRMHRQG